MPVVLFSAASVGAHLKSSQEGFRQKEVRFLIELLASWSAAPERRKRLPVLHNTQIMRALADLVADGWARRVVKGGKRGRAPRYQLTRAGLVGLLERLREEALTAGFETYSFIAFVFRSYRERILSHIEREGRAMPLNQRMAIQAVFDHESLVRDKLTHVDQEIEYWRRRIEENRKVIQETGRQLEGGRSIDQVVVDIEQRFPYELNYQKPLSQLLKGAPEDLKIWELTEGNRLRNESIWLGYIEHLKQWRKLLS